MSSTKKLYIFLFASFIIRACIAWFLELGNDEVYYVKYIQNTDFSYFDHPFMVGFVGQISTFNYHFQTEFFIRLGSLLIGTVNSYIIFSISYYLWNEKTAWISLILYSSSIYCSIIVGVFYMPDSPMTLFWLLALFTGLKAIRENKMNYLMLFGLLSAFAVASKYQAVYLPFGLFLFCFIFKRKWLFHYKTIFGFLLFFLGLIPTILWNIENNWVSFSFHKGRIGENGFHINYFLKEIFGEIFYNNPISVFLYYFTIRFILKTKKYTNESVAFLLLVSIPLIFTSVFLSFFTETFPHWSAPSYFSFILLAGYFIDSQKKWSVLPKYSLLFVLFITIYGFFEIEYGFIFNPKARDQIVEKKGKHDFTQDTFGWKQLGEKFSIIRKKYPDIQSIVSNKWYPASHQDYYVARPNNLELICEGNLHDIHQYYWINPRHNWKKAFYITSSNHFKSPSEVYPKYASKIIDTIAIYRRSDTIRVHFIYQLEK